MTAFVYVMGCADAECIKIGIAKDVGRRLALLQSGNPLEIKAVYSRGFDDKRASQVERSAHRHFKSKRIRGEWFRVSPNDAEAFIARQPEQVIVAEKGSHADLLSQWPSIGMLAGDMGKPYTTVNNWIGRSRVPMEYWVRLVDAAACRDIPLTYGQLAKGVAKDAA